MDPTTLIFLAFILMLSIFLDLKLYLKYPQHFIPRSCPDQMPFLELLLSVLLLLPDLRETKRLASFWQLQR